MLPVCLFYVRNRYPSIIATATLSNEGDRENATYSCYGKKQAMGDIFQHT